MYLVCIFENFCDMECSVDVYVILQFVVSRTYSEACSAEQYSTVMAEWLKC